MAAPGSEGDDLASRLRIAEAEAAWLRRVLRDKEQAFESEVLMLRRALTKAHEAVECERQQKELTPMLRLLPTDWVKVPTAGAAAQPIPTGPSAEGESIESVQSYGTPSPYLAMHPLARARQRLPWLLGLMLLQSMSSSIIGGYEAFIEQHINVAAYLTMILGTGGNLGGQLTAELIRALHVGDLVPSDLAKVCRDELLSGVFIGAACFGVAFVRTMLPAIGQCDTVEAAIVASGVFFVLLFASMLAPVLTFALHARSAAAQGAPPSLAVLTDLVGTTLLCVLIKRVWWSE